MRSEIAQTKRLTSNIELKQGNCVESSQIEILQIFLTLSGFVIDQNSLSLTITYVDLEIQKKAKPNFTARCSGEFYPDLTDAYFERNYVFLSFSIAT